MKIRILLLCDDQEEAQFWVFSLGQRGLEVVTAVSLPVALEMWGNNSYDLILINVAAPRTDERHLCRELRAQAVNPILLFTHSHDELEILAAYEAGADECIPKPVDLPLLLAKVNAWLRWSWMVPMSLGDGRVDGPGWPATRPASRPVPGGRLPAA